MTGWIVAAFLYTIGFFQHYEFYSELMEEYLEENPKENRRTQTVVKWLAIIGYPILELWMLLKGDTENNDGQD